MNAEKREIDESGSSDVEGVDSGAEGSPNVASATIPKKRGRPAKRGEKVEKKPPSGRGRGRPAKAPRAVVDVGSDDDAAVENGSKKARGRPSNLGKKKSNATAAGKGRGRPKAKRSADDDDVEEASPKKAKAATPGRRAGGRPRKAVSDDDAPAARHPKAKPETSEEDDEVDSKDEEDVRGGSVEHYSSAEEDNDVEYDSIDKKLNRSGGISADLAAA